MFEKLIRELKSRNWEYEILRDGLYRKQCLYFILGNEEVTIYKHEEAKAEYYLQAVNNW